MVDVIVKAKIGEVIWAQLDADGDLYDEIMEICRREKIESGVVLSIVGGLRKARLSMPLSGADPDAPPGVFELSGMMECSGLGTIGRTIDTYEFREYHRNHLRGWSAKSSYSCNGDARRKNLYGSFD